MDPRVEAAAYFVVAETAMRMATGKIAVMIRRLARPTGRRGSEGRPGAGHDRRPRGPRRRAGRDARGRCRRRRDPDPRGDPMRVVIADDEVLLREGLARLLAEAGFEVVGKAGDADELSALVELAPPGRRDRRHQDAADAHRRGARRGAGRSARAPARSASSCSRITSSRATRCGCSRTHPERVGYLLKDRVSDVAVLVDAARRIGDGECVLDPTIVSRLAGARASTGRSTS